MFASDIRDKVVVALREKHATITKQVVTGARISDFPDYKFCVGKAAGLDEAIDVVINEFARLLDEGE